MAEYIADKGLEGSGPIKVVNSIAPPGFRIALYVLFGIVGVAGFGIAVQQGSFGDAAVNGGFEGLPKLSQSYLNIMFSIGQLIGMDWCLLGSKQGLGSC